MTETPEIKSQRLDKWLWHARFAKTRSTAQRMVQAGKVRIDREKTNSASRQIRPGNVLTIAMARDIKVVEILDIAQRRNAFSQARLLYDDLTPKQEEKSSSTKSEEIADGMSSTGRPTKHQRKQIIQLKRNSAE